MYVAALRRLLEMYPAGASSEQLLYHLRTSGTRATAAEILQSLNMLSGSGEAAIIASGRWKLAKFLNADLSLVANQTNSGRGGAMQAPGTLFAVAGHILSRPFDELDAADEALPEGVSPDRGSLQWGKYWRGLLSYYAATQRADPRGKVTQFLDRHGEAWQLFAVRGCWWKGADLRFAMESQGEVSRGSDASKRKNLRTGLPVVGIRL
jgi:hypothetical protein